MDMQAIIDRSERNIRQALEDYRRHTSNTKVLDDVSYEFIHNLAHDSSYAKQGLRELFSKSPVWDESIDALVINGTRTHNPNYNRIQQLASEILGDRLCGVNKHENTNLIYGAISFFSSPSLTESDREYCIDCINQLAPKAYAPTKKPSRIFKAICDALGVSDDTAGSEFQRLYAQFADELSAKKIGFKMYVSINPAHFLTMSNPKCDRRGNTLTSCHSFNSTEYEYNNGCSGYARDETSFIVFTVADPAQPETLNNRKTTRQIFAYRPGSGLLMQSRMYNTSGGVYGAAEDSKLYRDLVQREISLLENVPNLWNTYAATKKEYSGFVKIGEGFGGYADWTYDGFDGHISFRKDCDQESVDPLIVGTWGLCISCGYKNNHGLYCECCDHDNDRECDECGDLYDEDDLYTVYDAHGNEIRVCGSCRDNYYCYCEHCEAYYPEECINVINDAYVCDDCCDEYYEQCEDCEEWHRRDYMFFVVRANGDEIMLCEDCKENFKSCPHCSNLIEICDDGTCPYCGVVVNEDEEDAE